MTCEVFALSFPLGFVFSSACRVACWSLAQVGVAASADSVFQQVSYVNAICTVKGGTHVECVANQVINKLLPVLKRKHKAEVRQREREPDETFQVAPMYISLRALRRRLYRANGEERLLYT